MARPILVGAVGFACHSSSNDAISGLRVFRHFRRFFWYRRFGEAILLSDSHLRGRPPARLVGMGSKRRNTFLSLSQPSAKRPVTFHRGLEDTLCLLILGFAGWPSSPRC